MKNFKLFKKLLVLAIVLLTWNAHAYADNWYEHNNSSIVYFNDYNTNWVSDPSSNGIAFLMGRDYQYNSDPTAGQGSQAYRMTHIDHTRLWYASVASWGTGNSAMYQYIAFRFASGTTGWNDWQSGWDNRPTARATYGSNTKYSSTRNDNITGRKQYYNPSSSDSNTGYSTVNNGLLKYTAYLRVRFDEDRTGYSSVVTGDATWAHSVAFDFTGTYMSTDYASAQSTIYNLSKNCWTDGGTKWGYADIPASGEVTFELKNIDSNYELYGWAYDELDATTPAYTTNPTNVTFNVLGNTSYVAFIRRKQFTVTYHTDGKTGGSAPSAETVLSGNTTTVKDNTGLMVKTGKVFAGWATTKDASTVEYLPNATPTITANLDLYPVWKTGYYLIEPGTTTKDGTNFIAPRTLGNNSSYGVNGVVYSTKVYDFSSGSAINGVAYDSNKHLIYDTQTDKTDVYIYAYNSGSANNFYCSVIKDGSTCTNETINVAANSGVEKRITIEHSKGTRVVVSVAATGIKICNIKTIERGDPLPAAGTSGYQLSFPGRPGAQTSSVDGITFSSNSNSLKFNAGTMKLTNGKVSEYIGFTTTSAIQLQVKISSNKYFYVCTDKSSSSTAVSTGFQSGGTSGTYSINLSSGNTYYITNSNGDLTIDKIAFADYVACTAPTGLAAGTITENGATFAITDPANKNNYEIVCKTTSGAPAADATPTATGTSKSIVVNTLSAGTTYYAWVRSVESRFNKSSWIALTGGTFTTTAACSATAPGSISKGSASGGTGTIRLTAAGDPATNNTWYWQSAADGTATNLGSGATKDVSATGTYYLRSYCSDNGGCWSDAVSVIVAAADLQTTPTATFSNGAYTIGSSALDLSSLWSSDSEGSVTYTVQNANGTGATISTAAFTATTAGTATVRASQAADGYYSAIYKDATITVSNPTYSVTYKANNSTAESDVVRGTESTFASNSTTTFTAPSTKAFAGWNTKADGSGTHYDVGDAVPSAITVYAEWWYKVYYIASSTSESNDITAALEDAKFAVSVKATTGTSYNASDYSDYALVVLSESLSGGDAATDGHELKVIVGLNKPILNLKTYFYGADGDASKRWKWGAPNAGKKPKCIYVKNDTYANLTSHPIFADLTPDGSDSIQILKTPLTTKPIQPIGSFVSGKEGYTLALVPNKSSGSGTAIHEMTAAQRSSATGETITSKYLLISIQEGELSNLSDDGKTLIKNAADYLITGSQWVPQYKITHSAASNGSYTIKVGDASAVSTNTTSAAGTTITLAATPSSGYELDSWTVTGDVSDDNITVTSNQFIMPAEAVTVAATFVLSGHSVTTATSTGSDTYGTVSAAAATVAEGGTTVITATPATGYKVTNWAVEGAGASIDPSGASNSNTTTLTMGSADATVTVTFGPKTYTLTLDKNGGSANGSASITWNQRLLSYSSQPSAPNASFSLDGYYTAATGGTKIISGGSSYIVGEYIEGWTTNTDNPSWARDDDATLYAHWRRVVLLNENSDYHGSTGGNVMVMLDGGPFSYTTATGESGYTLQGYYTEKLGGTKVFNADGTYAADDVDGYIDDGAWVYTTSGTLSLYAHWAKEFTVTYNGNSQTTGTAPAAQTNKAYGTTVTVASNSGSLAKTGYSFVGWNTANDGNGTFYAVGSTFTVTGDITLYAQWEDCSGSAETLASGTANAGQTGMDVTVGTITTNSLADKQDSYLKLNTSGYFEVTAKTGSAPIVEGDKLIVTMYNTKGSTQEDGFKLKSKEAVTTHTVSIAAESTGDVEYTLTEDDIEAGGTIKIFRTDADDRFVAIIVERSSGGGSCTTYNVSFANMTGFAGETTLPSTITGVYGGSTIAEPVTPKASGYAFAGWYKEGACTNKWDFSTDVVSSAKTLYAKWIDIDDTYTFHMGDGDIDNDSWKVATFTPTGYYENQAISNFEIPNQDRYPSFFVGYEGEFVEYAPSSGYSKMREWDGYNNMTTYQSGYIKIQGNASPISDGNTKTAAGAKGTLQMSSSTHSENWGLVFIPDGFGLTISYEEDETPKTLIVPLHQTDNEKVWETESFTTAKGNALTAAQIAGTFKVGLVTATPNVYVDCYQTTEEAASAINARKLVAAYGGADMAAGASGRFQIIMSSNTSLPNFGLRWVPLENHTKQSGSWDGMGVSYTLSDKWSLEHAPTIEEDVYIEHYTGITNDAQANSVYINKSTAYMNLTISSIGSLLVMNDIKAKMADDDAYRATTENDITIETDYIYNGSLITAKKSTDTKASYRFCTKAYKVDGYGYINQFIGIPFTEMDAFQLYGSLLYQYDKDANKWVTCSQNMEAYHAYNILRRSTEGRAVFDLDGTLILPGIEAGNKEKVLECNSGRSAEASSWRGEHLFANSWTAPIEIGAMTEGDFHDVDPTIYIFNAGSVNTATDDQKEEYDLGDNPGQWTALPVNDVKEHPENYSYKVIPAMQAFSIRATAANGTLTLDYKKHVYDPIMANSGVVDHTALRAPKQTVEPSVRLRMVVTGENHYKDETQIHERADFSNGHDAGWDGYKIFGNAHSPQLYTVSDNKQLSVNAIPDMEGTVVGFEKGSDDNVYTFSFKYDGEDIWYLNDLKEQTSTLINNENTYIFSAESGDAATRFIISATPIMKVTTGVENVQSDDVQSTNVHKVLINDHIYIIRGGRMYDATGKMLK